MSKTRKEADATGDDAGLSSDAHGSAPAGSVVPVAGTALAGMPILTPQAGTAWPGAGIVGYDQPPARGATIREYVGILWRYGWLVLLVSLVTAIVAWKFIRDDAPRFRASAAIRIADAKTPIAGTLAADVPDRYSSGWVDPILTQVQVMRSRVVASAVVDSVGLRLRSATPGFSIGYFDAIAVAREAPSETLTVRFSGAGVRLQAGRDSAFAPFAQPVLLHGVSFVTPRHPLWREAKVVVMPRDDAIDELLGSLDPKVREMTSVIDIGVTASDPVLAQRAANGVAEVLQQLSAFAAQQQSRRRRIFIEGQLQKTDQLLRQAEARIAEYRRGQQSYSAKDKFDGERVQFADISTKRRDLEAQRQAYQTLLQGLESHDVSSRSAMRSFAYTGDLTNNPAIGQLVGELLRLDHTRDSLTTGTFPRTAEHPEVRRVDGMIVSAETRLTSALRSQLASINASIRTIDAQAARQAGDIAALPAAAEQEARLLRNAENTRKMADKLTEELQFARISEAVEAGQVEIVDLARSGSGPIGTGRRRKLLYAILVGTLFGYLMAILVDRLNTSVRSEEDIETYVRVPSLGAIRRIDLGVTRSWLAKLAERLPGRVPTQPATHELVTLHDIGSGAAESYRTLLTNLLFGAAGSALRTVVVTSATAAEGKTTTAANLAVVFAQQGRSVVVVDCDLRRARLHETFAVHKEPGLTGVLAGTATLDQALVPSALSGLTILPSGRTPPSPLEFLAGARMRELLDELRDRFDVVLIDTPPVLAAADTSALAGQADAIALVVRVGRTDRDLVRRAAQQIVAVGGRLVGAILNDSEGKLSAYGYYGRYYYYYYQSYRGQEA